MTDTLKPTVADMLMEGPTEPVSGPIEMPVNIAPLPKQKRSAHKRPVFAPGDHNDEWRGNEELIADVMDLYLEPGMTLIDVTYGLGVFWKLGIPDRCEFIPHDIDPAKGDGVSFLDLPEADASADIIVLDPEYVARGGRKTSTLDEGVMDGKGMIARYAQDYAPKTPEALWTLIRTGMEEAHRVLKPKALLMLKCMSYISSATLQPYPKWALDAFDEIGFDLEDWAVLVGHPGPQPQTNKCQPCGGTGSLPRTAPGAADVPVCTKCNGEGRSARRQVHLRQNASHLLIGRKR